MKEFYTLNLDEKNYVRSIAHTQNDNIELDLSLIDSSYLSAYQYLNGELVLDEARKQAIITAESKKQLIIDERNKKSAEQQINSLKEELLKYDYIGVKIAMGVATQEEYAEQIAYTETIREQIRELENFRTEIEEPKEV